MAEITTDDIMDIKTSIASLRTLIETEAQRCPYREEIARASNNTEVVGKLIETVANLRLDFARAGINAGMAGGGAMGAIIMVLFVIAKWQKWL